MDAVTLQIFNVEILTICVCAINAVTLQKYILEADASHICVVGTVNVQQQTCIEGVSLVNSHMVGEVTLWI